MYEKTEKPSYSSRKAQKGGSLDFSPASGGAHADKQGTKDLNLKPGKGGYGYGVIKHGMMGKAIPKGQS